MSARRSYPRLMQLRWLLPVLFLFGAPSCGKEIGKVPLKGLGDTQTKEIELKGGTEVRFPVHIDKYSYSGRNYIMVQAELMKDDKVVETLRCRGYEFEGGAGSGCGGSMHYNSSCSTTVPSGGADAVRITTSLQNSGEVSVEGLAVGSGCPIEREVHAVRLRGVGQRLEGADPAPPASSPFHDSLDRHPRRRAARAVVPRSQSDRPDPGAPVRRRPGVHRVERHPRDAGRGNDAAA